MVCFKLHLNTNPIVEIELKLFTKWNLVHGVIIYTYQLADLGLARVSVQIVFLSAKRRSIQKASSPPPPPKTPWAFELLKTGSFKFPSPGAKIVFKHPT